MIEIICVCGHGISEHDDHCYHQEGIEDACKCHASAWEVNMRHLLSQSESERDALRAQLAIAVEALDKIRLEEHSGWAYYGNIATEAYSKIQESTNDQNR
jgi:hypothetical protein